jgi:hypothetical protein
MGISHIFVVNFAMLLSICQFHVYFTIHIFILLHGKLLNMNNDRHINKHLASTILTLNLDVQYEM